MTSINYQRGFIWKRIIWLVVAVIILGFLLYKAKEKVHTVIVNDQVTTPTISSIELKTYTNENYRFELKYPKNYIATTSKYDSLENKAVINLLTQEKYIDDSSFSIHANNTPEALINCFKNYDNAISQTKEVNGNIFYVPAEDVGDAAMGGERGIYSDYRIIENNYCYTISYLIHYHIVGYAGTINTGVNSATAEETQAQKDAISKNLEALHAMFSSIKFTPPNQGAITSDWRTYTSSKYGLILNYPQDWKVLEPNNTEVDTVYLQSPRLIKYLESHPGDNAHLPFYDMYIGIHGYQKLAYNGNAFHTVSFNGTNALEGSFEGDGVNTKEFIIDKMPRTYVISIISSTDTEIENKILSSIKFTT